MVQGPLSQVSQEGACLTGWQGALGSICNLGLVVDACNLSTQEWRQEVQPIRSSSAEFKACLLRKERKRRKKEEKNGLQFDDRKKLFRSLRCL